VEEIQFVVKYEVEGFEGTQEAGPYPTREIAMGHMKDIMGYEGVKACRIGKKVPDIEVPETIMCSVCGFAQKTARRTGMWFAAGSIETLAVHFQCCPEHAAEAAETFFPLALDGFETWGVDFDERGFSISPDHVVAEGPVMGQGVFGLDAAIKEALGVKLVWEQDPEDETKERAFDPVVGEWVRRPHMDRAKKIALHMAMRTFAEEVAKVPGAGEAARLALQRFSEAARGLSGLTPRDEPTAFPQGQPDGLQPGPHALEDRRTFGFLRQSIGASLRGALSPNVVNHDLVREIVEKTVQGVLGQKAIVRKVDIREGIGGVDLSVDICLDTMPTVESLTIDLTETAKKALKQPFDTGPTSALGMIKDIVAAEVAKLSPKLDTIQREIEASKTQQVQFLQMGGAGTRTPIMQLVASMPGAHSVEVKITPEWDPSAEQIAYPHMSAGDMWTLTAGAPLLMDGRYTMVFKSTTSELQVQHNIEVLGGAWYF
jgi:hypothetical protein